MAGVYRPRHPERTVLYRVLFHCFDRFPAEYEGRFEKEYGFFRPLLSLERLSFDEKEGKVIYRYGKETEELERMDWLEFIARLTSHIPDKGQVTVRYYGLYANAHRRKATDGRSSRSRRKGPAGWSAGWWARWRDDGGNA